MSNENRPNLTNLKKNLSLDLGLLSNAEMTTMMNKVDTPDLLKMDTPTIENMILFNNLPNPSTPSLMFPRSVTAEQETFADGFEEALQNLHKGHVPQESDSNASTCYNDGSNFMPIIKEEPQTVPGNNTPPMSPVDMEHQERIKLERKRQRNRLAASKCRSRKLERISKLEDKVKLLKTDNTELASLVNQMREQVGQLKVEVMEHVNAGCPIINQF